MVDWTSKVWAILEILAVVLLWSTQREQPRKMARSISLESSQTEAWDNGEQATSTQESEATIGLGFKLTSTHCKKTFQLKVVVLTEEVALTTSTRTVKTQIF